MGMTATVTLECDNCETDVTEDLELSQSPEDMIDQQGWYLTGPTLTRLLCEDCYEKEEGDG